VRILRLKLLTKRTALAKLLFDLRFGCRSGGIVSE
jgi:hypothetical protein